jgi:alpha-galactosidase
VNKEKFPNGLKPLIDKVHSLGMDFGLWVEPEMVNPDSDLYRAHPDWVLNFPGAARADRAAQSAGAESGAARMCATTSSASGQAADRERYCLS